MTDGIPAAARDDSRAVIEAVGADAESFLQGLWSNDVARAGASEWVYAAHLTPQGKLLADAFIGRPSADRFLLDAPASQAVSLIKRLTMYKLRAAVQIAERADLAVFVGLGEGDGVAGEIMRARDPRGAMLGFRAIAASAEAQACDLTPYHAACVEAGAPRFDVDLAAGDAFILEYDFERLAGVDFKKGCYVGQEVTARMRHRTDLRRGLFRVRVDGAAEPGDEITSNGKPAGRLGARVGDMALALLRKDRLDGALAASDAPVTVVSEAGEVDG